MGGWGSGKEELWRTGAPDGPKWTARTETIGRVDVDKVGVKVQVFTPDGPKWTARSGEGSGRGGSWMKGSEGVYVSPLQTALNGRPGAGVVGGEKATVCSLEGRDGIILFYQFLYLPVGESQGDWPARGCLFFFFCLFLFLCLGLCLFLCPWVVRLWEAGSRCRNQRARAREGLGGCGFVRRTLQGGEGGSGH